MKPKILMTIKLLGTKIFKDQFFWTQIFSGHNFFQPKIFRTQNFWDPNNFGTLNCHNPNSTSTQPQLNSTELGLTWLLLFTPHPPPHHRELYFHRMQHQINLWCCLNININIKDNNNKNKNNFNNDKSQQPQKNGSRPHRN